MQINNHNPPQDSESCRRQHPESDMCRKEGRKFRNKVREVFLYASLELRGWTPCRKHAEGIMQRRARIGWGYLFYPLFVIGTL